MKNFFLFLILIFIASCSEKSGTSKQITAYYEGFKSSDYEQVKNTLADTLTITEGDYIMNFTHESFYEHFKWDSVFQPTYNLVKLENEQGHIVATVSVHSLRFDFLKNNPLTCKHKFHFKSGKISKIENVDCMDTDWELWQKERDSLVNWIKVNHPELDGFIHDLSMQGALNYLNAIELYEER